MNTVNTRVQRPTIVGAVLALLVSLLLFAAPAQAATATFTTDATAVSPAALPEVTPIPVTFPDACTVVVPATAGVIYSVTIDGDTSEIDADTYDGADFDGDSAAVFTAAADDEHVLAADAETTWNYTPADECFGDTGNDKVVTAKTSCSAVTFTNITPSSVEVLYGDSNQDDADGDFKLAAGASKKVKTSRSTLDFVAFSEDDELSQLDTITVPQNCGSPVNDPKPTVKWPHKHPTVAPAAGVTGDEGGSSVPLLALLGVASLIAARRAYALGR